MANATKKFLDQAGTSHLWSKIKQEIDKKGQVNSVTAADNSIVIAGTATAPTVAVKVSNKAGNILVLETTSGAEGLYVPPPTVSSAYTIIKDAEAATGYAATYHLTKDGVNVGTAINIPKDMVISGGEVKTVTTADTPYSGAVVGDKYIEITLANNDGTKLYIPANSLVEYVTSGSGANDMVVISINANHQVTASITDGSITATKLHTDLQTVLSNALQTNDITSGTTNGTIKVKNTEVAVTGLGTAAYEATTAFDAAGAADDVYNAIIALTNAEIDTAITNANSGT